MGFFASFTRVWGWFVFFVSFCFFWGGCVEPNLHVQMLCTPLYVTMCCNKVSMYPGWVMEWLGIWALVHSCFQIWVTFSQNKISWGANKSRLQCWTSFYVTLQDSIFEASLRQAEICHIVCDYLILLCEYRIPSALGTFCSWVVCKGAIPLNEQMSYLVEHLSFSGVVGWWGVAFDCTDCMLVWTLNLW